MVASSGESTECHHRLIIVDQLRYYGVAKNVACSLDGEGNFWSKGHTDTGCS